MEQKYCITIARQFGSLGRQIGKQLAKELDIAYYDRELLEHAAESMGLPVSSLADLDDKMSRKCCTPWESVPLPPRVSCLKYRKP